MFQIMMKEKKKSEENQMQKILDDNVIFLLKHKESLFMDVV